MNALASEIGEFKKAYGAEMGKGEGLCRFVQRIDVCPRREGSSQEVGITGGTAET